MHAASVISYSTMLGSLLTNPVGAMNVSRLCETFAAKSTFFCHPEIKGLTNQYQLGRSMADYFKKIPGLQASLRGPGVMSYMDVGAGYAIAAWQIARTMPGLNVLAITKTDFKGGVLAPPNMLYKVGDAVDVLMMPSSHNVISDLYGAFTFDVHNQVRLLNLYSEKLRDGGAAHIYFDVDHVAVMSRLGVMMLFTEWIDAMQHPDISTRIDSNPSGPTSLASVITIRKTKLGLRVPDLALVGVKQYDDDIVPFLVYEESAGYYLK